MIERPSAPGGRAPGADVTDQPLSDPLAVAEFELTPEEWVEAAVAYLFPHDLHRANRAKQRRAYTLVGGAMAILSARHGMVDGLFGPHRLEVRREFLRDVTSGYETRWRWESVRGVGENEGTFLIRVGPTALLPLPASAFRDGDSLRRFGDAFYAQLAGARGALDDGASR
jgi:hypothetical protein